MTIETKIFTWLHGKHVGTDELGNRYFIQKKAAKGKLPRRWVMYAHAAEPSSVPPQWHGWLHHTTDITPSEQPRTEQAWQKPGRANLSGSDQAHRPGGHLLNTSQQRQKNVADYQPWQPS